MIVLCSFDGNSKGIMSALNQRCLSMSRICCDASSWPEEKKPLVDKGEFDSLNRWSHTGSLWVECSLPRHFIWGTWGFILFSINI